MLRLLALAALLASCGVKQPPIAPQRRPIALVTLPPNLHCSPADENCDERDSHYVPAAATRQPAP